MAKLFHFIILCILQLYSLCLNTPMLYAYHLCSYDQSLSLLNFKSSLQIDTYSEYCTNEVGFFSFRNISSYCNRNGNPIIESKITSWNNNTDCCSWEGVTCDKFTGNVVELDLSDSRLIGVIDSNSTIFRLSHLKRLNLSYNSFYGSEISSEFHRLTHLSHLDLSNSEFQGQIPHEISQLNQLVSLDLSPNLIGLTLQPHIFKSILQNMTSLKELFLQNVKINSTFPKNLSSSLTIINLMRTELRGTFPYHIFNLPKLQQLNLGFNSFDHFGNSMSVKWNTSSPLQKLELSQVFLLEKQLESIGNLRSLLYLDISFCDLMGTLPQSFGNLTQLSYLDLSDNNFNGQLPKGILALERLTFLGIGTNSLDAPIPHSASNNLKRLKVVLLKENQLTSSCVSSFLSNLTQLETIDLSRNPLYEIPPELFELSLLQSINLEETQLHGHIPNSFSNLINLQHLNLGSNNVSSHIGTIGLSKLVSLVSLNLASNKFIGPIESKTFSNLVNLKYLNLGSNNFNGPIEIDALVNLVYLDLSSNNFGTTLDVKFFSNLKWMDLLDLSFSNVSLINEDTTTLPMVSIRSLFMASCNIREFGVLRSIVVAEDLFLPNNNIHGEIPAWVWSSWTNVSNLDLSNNFITHIGSKIPLQHLGYLNLRSNLIEGQLPHLPHSINLLSLSNNKFHGEINPSICELDLFFLLDLSNNSFSGAIPHCIGMLIGGGLHYLHLHMNKLQGTIPDTFSVCRLTSLNLRGNNLEGKVPRSLINCSDLQFLDLSQNNLNDTFPIWLGDLPNLGALSLRSNNFFGPLSSLRAFSSLRILDLSYNQLSGSLPARIFHGFKEMMRVDSISPDYFGLTMDFFLPNGFHFQLYNDSMTMVLNGNNMQVDRLRMDMAIIDLSCNHFEGEIPNSIGGLVAIRQLNLSHNKFTGQIPPHLGKLSNLQSLDLSSNQLDGNIPDDLAALGFLSVMNLSYNRLTGKIPSGRQIQALPNNSYVGNDGLCGFPLSRSCGSHHNPSITQSPHPGLLDEEDHQEFFDGFTWQSVLVGYGVGICVGLVIGTVMLFNEKPKWLIRIIQEEAHKIGYKYKSRNGISFTWNTRS